MSRSSMMSWGTAAPPSGQRTFAGADAGVNAVVLADPARAYDGAVSDLKTERTQGDPWPWLASASLTSRSAS